MGKEHPVPSEATNFLGVRAGEVGAALAGALVTEIAQAAVERLFDRTSGDSRSQSKHSDTLQDTIKNGKDVIEHSVPETATHLKNELSDSKPFFESAVDSVKTAVGDAAPNLIDVVNTLKGVTEVAKQSVQPSTDAIAEGVDTQKKNLNLNRLNTVIQQSVKDMVENATSTMQGTLDIVNSAKTEKSGKKKGKKKNKNKKKSKKAE